MLFRSSDEVGVVCESYFKVFFFIVNFMISVIFIFFYFKYRIKVVGGLLKLNGINILIGCFFL